MLLELAVALSLTQIQDTCVIDSNSVYTRAYHVACAGNFNTWGEVIDFRHIANKEGFGSTAILQPDSSYELSFVLFGDSSTVYSQWIRLNELLGLNLGLRKPTIGEVKPEENIVIKSLPPRVPIVKLNVSAWDQRVLITEPPAPLMQKDTIAIVNSAPLVESVPDSAFVPYQNDSLLIEEESFTTMDSDQTVNEVQLEVKDSIVAQGVATSIDASIIDEAKEPSNDLVSAEIVEAEPILSEPTSDQVIVNDQIEESVLNSQSSSDDQTYGSIEEEVIQDKDPFTNYLIVFGSYGDRQSALKHRDELRSEGILAVIKPHKSYFRVGIYYDYYPNKELAKFKKSHAPCWVATIKTK